MSKLLDEMMEACGGKAAWDSYNEVRIEGNMGGMLLLLHNREIDYDLTRNVRVNIREPKATISDFPVKGQTGFFQAERVCIIDDATGEILRSRDRPRKKFITLPASIGRLFKWDDLDVLYFVGYAVWNYFLTPYMFTFPGFRTEELEPEVIKGMTFRKLRVHYPPGIPTHNTPQVYFVNPKNLISKFQYNVEVTWLIPLNGDHFCSLYKEFTGGIKLSTRRRVYAQKNTFLRRLRAKIWVKSLGMHGDIYNIEFVKLDHPVGSEPKGNPLGTWK